MGITGADPGSRASLVPLTEFQIPSSVPRAAEISYKAIPPEKKTHHCSHPILLFYIILKNIWSHRIGLSIQYYEIHCIVCLKLAR